MEARNTLTGRQSALDDIHGAAVRLGPDRLLALACDLAPHIVETHPSGRMTESDVIDEIVRQALAEDQRRQLALLGVLSNGSVEAQNPRPMQP